MKTQNLAKALTAHNCADEAKRKADHDLRNAREELLEVIFSNHRLDLLQFNTARVRREFAHLDPYELDQYADEWQREHKA